MFTIGMDNERTSIAVRVERRCQFGEHLILWVIWTASLLAGPPSDKAEKQAMRSWMLSRYGAGATGNSFACSASLRWMREWMPFLSSSGSSPIHLSCRA